MRGSFRQRAVYVWVCGLNEHTSRVYSHKAPRGRQHVFMNLVSYRYGRNNPWHLSIVSFLAAPHPFPNERIWDFYDFFDCCPAVAQVLEWPSSAWTVLVSCPHPFSLLMEVSLNLKLLLMLYIVQIWLSAIHIDEQVVSCGVQTPESKLSLNCWMVWKILQAWHPWRCLPPQSSLP